MSFYNNDATPSNNTAVNGIDIQGTANVSNFDNALRETLAQTKQFAQDLGGANTVGGTGDAITITPAASDTISSAFEGMMIGFEAGADNTTTVTANVGSIGAKPVKKTVDGVETALAAGDIQDGGLYLLRWRAAWDSSNGAWQLLSPAANMEASTTVKGPVELATVAEAKARTDTARALTAVSVAAFGLFATGAYVGDGTTSHAITGLGFQPKALVVIRSNTDTLQANMYITSDTIMDNDPQGMALLIDSSSGGNNRMVDNAIISLDSDGFTVDDAAGDADPNTNGAGYNYMAWG